MSVSQAQASIDSYEFSEWMAFHRFEPFTQSKTDHLLCTIAAILVNAHSGKGAKIRKPGDFMPQHKTRKIQSADEIQQKLRAIF